MDLTKEEWDREFEQRSKMGVWSGALRPIATNVDLEPVLKFKDEQYKTNQESTVLSNLGTVAGNVLKGAGRGVLGAAKAAIDYNIEQHKKADPNYRPYNDFATDASDTLQSGVNALERTEIKTDSATEKLAYDLLEGAGQLAVQIALASATGGTTAAAYMATITAGDQYLDLRKQGVDAERAAQAGLINAPMQLALEKIGIGKIMNKLPKDSPLRKRMTDILVTGITEGVTEGLQEIPEQLTNIWAKDKNADVSSVAKAWQGDWQENVKEIGYSGLIGGILGGGAKGAMHIVDANVRNYVQAKVNDAQKEFIAQNIEQIKKNGIDPNDAAVYINANSDNGTITVEAKDVQGYMQTANPEKIAKELGVTVDEVNKAAAAGQDIDINIGNFTAACSTNEGLFEATKDGMLFNANGELSSRDLAMQGEIARESTLSEREAVELDNEIETIVKSAKEAGVAEKQAEDLGLIIESRAMVANPSNPAEWLKKNRLRFENAGKKPANNGWLQAAAFVNEYKNTESFMKEIASLDKNEFNKRSYKYKHKNGGTYEVLSTNFGHVKNGTHNLTPEQWDDILTNLDDINSIEEARISDAKGLHGGTIVFQKVKGTLGTYGVITEYSTSGRVFVTTAGMDGGPNVNVNNWAKKVRGSQILQQKALKLTAGKVGQSSYTKILQERLGIVKRFYKQLEKGAILPQVDGSYIISLFKHIGS